MTEVSMGGPSTPSPGRPRRYFPSFVREAGISQPPPRIGAPVPTEEQALAALRRYREFPTPEDNALVQRWIAAVKDDPAEHARRIRSTQ